MRARWRSRLKGPVEGWFSLVLVTIMSLTLAWSMDDAAWVLGRAPYLDFLVPSVVWAVAIGFIGAKIGWGRWLTYLLGAVAAGLVVPLYVGNVLLPDGAWVDQYRATATAVVEAYTDLAIQNQSVTQQYGHFLVVLGGLAWATGLFAAYATFGHRRPLNAIVLVGLLLVGNMSFTYNNQLTFLVIYSLAALFLLIRFHAFDEETEWVRRRIGDPAAVSAIYLRGGSAFIAIAVVGSLVLTQTASSAPLAGALRGFGDQLVEYGRDFERLLPQGGANRTFGVDFGSTARISNNWNIQPGPAVTIELPADAPRAMYWRAAAYDQVEPAAWRQRERIGATVDPGLDLLAGGSDEVGQAGRVDVRFRVIPEGYRKNALLSPATPITVDHAVRLSVVGPTGFFAAIEGNGEEPYTITARVPVVGDAEDPEGLTANRLRVAGTAYPAEVAERFLEVPPDVAPDGGATEALLAEIRAATGDPDNPYDLAVAMQTYLRSNEFFKYSTNLQGVDCQGLSTAECFARERIGFCQQYATTMAVMLRMAGIPSRYVSGFLPAQRIDNVERIPLSSAHAWVEAYFPNYGWVLFDPTGGGLPGQTDPLPQGEVVASPSPSSSGGPAASGPASTRRPFDEPPGGGPVQGGTNNPTGTGSAGILIAVTLLLLISVGGIAYVAWQRGPRGELTPDRAYGALTRMAGRLGFAPRPTQTVYEYAGALGDVLPQSRPEIQTVAQAKVEVAYGRRALGADRMAALHEAQRRLRLGLLRLLLRRSNRPRRR